MKKKHHETPAKARATRLRRDCAALLSALAIFPAASPALAEQPDALVESYANWTVQCQAVDAENRLCWMGQSLQQNPGGETVLQVEFAILEDTTTLALLAPFGLLLPAGATLTVNDSEPTTTAFRTCMPVGCLTQETLSEEQVQSLRDGEQLRIGFVISETDTPLIFELSLDGFGAAHARLAEIINAQ